tara:strand:- start:425 stop:595 length:171 start_codon:yes stop_codon:yes gene_type:complete
MRLLDYTACKCLQAAAPGQGQVALDTLKYKSQVVVAVVVATEKVAEQVAIQNAYLI